ncbi:MAG TPA: hypothetical protein PLI89_14250 [Chitinophagales bacterium]|nr:hypothetical protein [Chitinophagales bacterium]
MPNPKVFEGKSLLIKDVPIDVQETLIQQMADDKDACNGCFRTQEQALYKIVREYKMNQDAMKALSELVKKPFGAKGHLEAWGRAIDIVVKHEATTRNRNGHG